MCGGGLRGRESISVGAPLGSLAEGSGDEHLSPQRSRCDAWGDPFTGNSDSWRTLETELVFLCALSGGKLEGGAPLWETLKVM